MAEVTIDSKRLQDALNKLVSKLSDSTPAFKDIADLEWAQTRMRFTKQVDPDGKKWAEPFTIRRDGSGGRNTQFNDPWNYVVKSNYQAAPPGYHFFDSSRGDKILRDTSGLFNSIGRAYGKDYAVVGTNLEYARANQEGDGKRKARPFIGINQKTVENVLKVLKLYLQGSKK